jgi:asparagine synthase (glutamine-hydrolysing)
MQVGFTLFATADSIRVALHGPDSGTRRSLVGLARDGDAILALVGRLHYRRDAIERLRARMSVENLDHDAALALATYRQFGTAGLEKLEGDFALVLWDGRKVVAQRDPMGGYPLFWTESAAGFAVGTSMAPLLDNLGRHELRTSFVADYLTMFTQRNEMEGTATAYEGIERVAPGSFLTWRRETRQADLRPYWDWAQQITDPGTDSFEEAAEMYAAQLRTAIRERMHGSTMAHLSGGMDSTAVALLAGEHSARGQAGAVRSVSLVYEKLPKLAAERPFIEGVLEPLQGVTIHRLLGDDLLDYDAVHDTPATDEPYPGFWRMQMDRALFEEADRAGVDTILTGVGADEILETQPYFLADLLRGGRWLKAWREAGRWSSARNDNKWRMLKSFGFSVLGWDEMLLGRRSPRSLAQQTEASVPAWIRPEFAARHRLFDRASAARREAYRRHPKAQFGIMIHSLRSEAGDPVRWALAAPRHVDIAHPFLDCRLLRLGMSLQSRLAPQPGRMKPLLAEAMRDVLPPAIAKRRAKGHFDEVYYLGLGRNLPALERMIDRCPEAVPFLDKKALRSALHEATMAGADARKLFRFDLTLSLVSWLVHERNWTSRPVAVRETDVLESATANGR